MRKSIIIRVMMAVLPLGALSSPAAAQPAQTMPVQALAKGLVDGKPWNWTVPDGKKGRLTFSPNGKALFEGPIRMDIKWVIKGDTFCLKMGMMLGTKCLTGRAVKGGYQTFEKNKAAFHFTR
jgi:hypothetical protein